ncbi:MAG: phosphatase PAP2 family protein [Desulfofustis sp.]|jgi:membrane-associated phospholipid phosphatase|nr:phosphatase PAP2 family protein [Desulfofustis sp.]
MMISSSARSRRVPHHTILLAAIILFAAAAMTALVPFEIPLTRFVSAHRANWFVELMGDSLFELEQPGGGDLVVIFLIVSVLLYIGSSLVDSDCSRLPVIPRLQRALLVRPMICDALRRHRLRLEFLLVSSFCCSILMVKTLKWIMARPRPKRILFGGEPFSNWYEFGPYFLDHGLYRASFPSGHAALAITLIGLAYVVIYSGSWYRRPARGSLLLLSILVFAAAMATARIMSIAHWPTDVAFSLFGGWLLIHCLFFYGLRVASLQGDSYRYRGQTDIPPAWRAFRLCWYLSLLCLAFVMVVLGLRHFFFDHWPWLILFSFVAVPLFAHAWRRVCREGLFCHAR